MLPQHAVRALRLVEVDSHHVAELGAQVVGRPAVERDLILRELNRFARVIEQRPDACHRIDAGNRRIGNLPLAVVVAAADHERIGQVRHDRLRRAAANAFSAAVNDRVRQDQLVRTERHVSGG